MMHKTIFIKNMVCPRCIEAVRNILESKNIRIESIELGKVVSEDDIKSEQLTEISELLQKSGFEILEDKNEKIVHEIKSFIIYKIHHSENISEHLNFSQLLSEKLNRDYKYLSSVFSSMEGITIEKYIILQKIEKVKELLSYNEMNLNEISYKMGYSSVQYLSSQFRKITGLTPSRYAKLQNKQRTSLDNINGENS